jgi:hypothetical protein
VVNLAYGPKQKIRLRQNSISSLVAALTVHHNLRCRMDVAGFLVVWENGLRYSSLSNSIHGYSCNDDQAQDDVLDRITQAELRATGDDGLH